MPRLKSLQAPIVIAAACALAAIAGLLLVSPAPKAPILLGVLVVSALAVVAFEQPLTIYALLLVLLGLFSESPVDNLVPGNGTAWNGLIAGVSPAGMRSRAPFSSRYFAS